METMIETEMTMAELFEKVLGGSYEVETPQGWKPLKELVKKPKEHCWLLRFSNGAELGASDDHLVKTSLGSTLIPDPEPGFVINASFCEWKSVKDIVVGDSVACERSNGSMFAQVVAKEYLGARDTYDFQVDSEEHAYYANGIESHNTGKTTIGNIICNEAPDSTVILITPELIAENNNGKQSIKLLYMLADFVSPAVIFLEDLDLFGEDRDNSQGDVALGGLMNILDGVNQVKNAVTVATTNRLELIEKALSNRPGRFDRVVEVPTMMASLRTRMFTDRLEGCKVDSGVVDQIVKLSDGWTGAECQEFINSMNLYFIHKNKDDERHITELVVNDVAKIIKNLSTTRKPRKGMGFGD